MLHTLLHFIDIINIKIYQIIQHNYHEPILVQTFCKCIANINAYNRWTNIYQESRTFISIDKPTFQWEIKILKYTYWPFSTS